MSFKTVAIAGASGNLGPSIVDALLAAGFAVTILTRGTAEHTFPAAAKVVPVDYASVDSLAAALQGQDALVITLGPPFAATVQNLIDAAVRAGVQRIVPSEFGSNTLNDKVAALGVLGEKIAVRQTLEAKAAAGALTYTAIINGPFFDWGLRIGWIADLRARSITLWDGGDRPYSATTLATVGRAVAAALQRPDATKNRVLYVQDVALSQKQLLAKAKQALGPDGWTATEASIDAHLAEGVAGIQSDPAKYVLNFISTAIWGDGYGSHFEKTDNALLGIPELTDDELVALIKKVAA